jgi:micrococcal nuclease
MPVSLSLSLSLSRTPRRTAEILMTCALLLTGVALTGSPAAARSSLGPSYRVARVADGDTITVTIRGTKERVRLIGIDTPELARDGEPDECHARAARSAMKKLVAGTRVHLKRDSSQANRDRYGRLLRYVYTAKKKRDVGRTLIRQGRGREYTYRKGYKHRSAHRKAQRQARAENRGLWRACASTEAPAPTADPGTCAIKGNISSSGERIYHVPGPAALRRDRHHAVEG